MSDEPILVLAPQPWMPCERCADAYSGLLSERNETVPRLARDLEATRAALDEARRERERAERGVMVIAGERDDTRARLHIAQEALREALALFPAARPPSLLDKAPTEEWQDWNVRQQAWSASARRALAAQPVAGTTGPLTLERFSEMNRRRCESVHGFGESLQPDSKYTLLAWACSIASEAGEVCDAVVGYEGLKERRSGKTRDDIAEELADVITYCDLAIQKLGLWTPDVLVKKFHAVNARLEEKDPHCGAVTRFALAAPASRDSARGTVARFGMTAHDVAKCEQLARPPLTMEQVIAAGSAPPSTRGTCAICKVDHCIGCHGDGENPDGSPCPDCAHTTEGT